MSRYAATKGHPDGFTPVEVRIWEDIGEACPDVPYPVEVVQGLDDEVLVLTVAAAKKLRKDLKKVIKELEELGYA